MLHTTTADETAVRRLADELFITPALPAGANLWETWGSYRLACRCTAAGWRLVGFRYDSRLTRGDDAVRTHGA